MIHDENNMREWFTRFPQKSINQTYLKNMVEATRLFMNWFNAGTNSYIEILSKMHKIVSKDYSGHTSSRSPLIVRNSFRDKDTEWFPVLRKDWFDSDKITLHPKVKGMPVEQSHWLEDIEEGYMLHLPDGKYVHNYLNLMSKLIENTRTSNALNLKLLVNYIQLFVIGHPFEKINYSICMAQINAILHMKGFKTLYHEYLDFECFAYDYDVIEDKFLKKFN